jgi:hypothetical protein
MSTQLPDSNPYAPPLAHGGVDDWQNAAGPPTREEFEAFVGSNARVYWDLLQSALRPRNLLAGFNMAAAFWSTLWLLYRKMYREFAVTVALAFLASTAYFAVTGRRERYDLGLLVGLYVAAAIGLGILGNGLYLRRIHAAVSLARRQSPEPSVRLAFLAKRGGTSWLALAILVAARIAYAMGVLIRQS